MPRCRGRRSRPARSSASARPPQARRARECRRSSDPPWTRKKAHRSGGPWAGLGWVWSGARMPGPENRTAPWTRRRASPTGRCRAAKTCTRSARVACPSCAIKRLGVQHFSYRSSCYEVSSSFEREREQPARSGLSSRVSTPKTTHNTERITGTIDAGAH